MNKLIVEETAEISGHGLALFFQYDPDPIPKQYRICVQITRPDGFILEAVAFREFARKVPPGEVVVFLLRDVAKKEIPVGSTVRIVEETTTRHCG